MTAFQRFARRAVLAAVTTATLAAAGAASADVLIAKSECIDGFWHVRTYDITNPGKEVLVEDKKTEQRCEVTPTAMPRPQINGGYHLEPTYQLRPTLRYQFEEPQPQRPMRIPLRYAF
jgi:hypothetical protein